MVLVCEKGGTLPRKEGDGNEVTREKEERKTQEKTVGQKEGRYQREATVD